jgi:hypothetical protein
VSHSFSLIASQSVNLSLTLSVLCKNSHCILPIVVVLIRMDETLTEHSFIGEIHITTKIVAVEAAPNNSSSSSSSNNNNNNSEVSASVQRSGWSSKASADNTNSNNSNNKNKNQLVLTEKVNKQATLRSSALLFRYSPLTCWHPVRKLSTGGLGYIRCAHRGLLLRQKKPQRGCCDDDLLLAWEQVRVNNISLSHSFGSLSITHSFCPSLSVCMDV